MSNRVNIHQQLTLGHAIPADVRAVAADAFQRATYIGQTNDSLTFSIKFEISQPLIELNGNPLEFGGGSEIDFNGKPKAKAVVKWEF